MIVEVEVEAEVEAKVEVEVEVERAKHGILIIPESGKPQKILKILVKKREADFSVSLKCMINHQMN